MRNLNFKNVCLIIGPVISILIVLFADLQPGHPEVTYTCAVAVLMAIWWITEAIPLAATSLLPVVLFPLLGVMDGKEVSNAYFNHLIFLFIGGFVMALAMEKWNLHKRIALNIMKVVGLSPGRILLGFMLASAFLSMWMSNTATTMMMVPIVISVIYKLEELIGKADIGKYSTGLLLGVGFASSIGGIATLVGTPPNLSFARIYNIMFPAAPEVSFASWLLFALPVTVLMFAATWALLYYMHRSKKKWTDVNLDTFAKERKALGPASFEEKSVFTLFIVLALMWITRADIRTGFFTIPGWSGLFEHDKFFNDGTVAIFISVLLFCIPSVNNKGKRLMDWETAKKLPWNIVLLFGGGFALAGAFVESGLSTWFGEQLSKLSEVHPAGVIAGITSLMAMLTELTSNTATTEMLLPILAGLSTSIKVHPLLFMLPATLAASLAFMMPVATPPNAIIFGTQRLKITEMIRAGIFLNIIGIIIVTLATWFWGTYVFDIDIGVFPDWANTPVTPTE